MWVKISLSTKKERINLSMMMFVPSANLFWICFSFSHLCGELSTLFSKKTNKWSAEKNLNIGGKRVGTVPVGREEEMDSPIIKFLTTGEVRVDHRADACSAVWKPENSWSTTYKILMVVVLYRIISVEQPLLFKVSTSLFTFKWDNIVVEANGWVLFYSWDYVLAEAHWSTLKIPMSLIPGSFSRICHILRTL